MRAILGSDLPVPRFKLLYPWVTRSLLCAATAALLALADGSVSAQERPAAAKP
jgi:hypothetical protein